MPVTMEACGNTLIFRLAGRLDNARSSEFEQLVTSAIRGGQLRVIVDFTQVEYIGSAGLRAVLHAGKALHERDGTLALAGLLAHVGDAFRVCGFLELFAVYSSTAEAVAALS